MNILTLYRKYIANEITPLDIITKYTYKDLISNFKIIKNEKQPLHNIIFSIEYKKNMKQFDDITDYFIYDIRIQCKLENEDVTIHDYLKSLGKINKKDIRQVMYKANKIPSCTLLSIRRLMHVIKFLFGDNLNIKYIDCSSGWGDRMITALLLGIPEYVGYDPNKKLISGHSSIIEYFKSELFGFYQPSKRTYNKYKVNYDPFEEDHSYEKEYDNYFDFCVSSPPFFTFEIYDTSETQSANNYKTIDDWYNKFLLVAFEKLIRFIKVKGYLCWYIEDKPEYPFIDKFIDHVSKMKNVKYMGFIGYKYSDQIAARKFYLFQKIE